MCASHSAPRLPRRLSRRDEPVRYRTCWTAARGKKGGASCAFSSRSTPGGPVPTGPPTSPEAGSGRPLSVLIPRLRPVRRPLARLDRSASGATRAAPSSRAPHGTPNASRSSCARRARGPAASQPGPCRAHNRCIERQECGATAPFMKPEPCQRLAGVARRLPCGSPDGGAGSQRLSALIAALPAVVEISASSRSGDASVVTGARIPSSGSPEPPAYGNSEVEE